MNSLLSMSKNDMELKWIQLGKYYQFSNEVQVTEAYWNNDT